MINRDFLEPITEENIHELKPGDWIWDNRPITRRAHTRRLHAETVTEPIGFRQIDILDLKDFGTIWNNQPFVLRNSDKDYRSEWVYFHKDRFWKFKSDDENGESNDEIIDKLARFFEENPDNWSELKDSWLNNGRSDDLRALFEKALESEE